MVMTELVRIIVAVYISGMLVILVSYKNFKATYKDKLVGGAFSPVIGYLVLSLLWPVAVILHLWGKRK